MAAADHSLFLTIFPNTPPCVHICPSFEPVVKSKYASYEPPPLPVLPFNMAGVGTALPIPPPPTDLAQLVSQEQQLVFGAFTAQTAWELGGLLRGQLLAQPKPTTIDITLSSRPFHTLFHCALPGTVPDNENWVVRKRRTVLRFGRSTWYMHNKYGGDEALFAAKNGLRQDAGDYAIHGGGFPIRVKGVEGVIGVIVVSGLAQSEDHGIIVKVVHDYLETLGEPLGALIVGDAEGEKKKED